MAETFQWAWRGDSLVDYRDLTIHAESMAMRYALAAFEGVRGYVPADGGGVRYFALNDHIERLQRTLTLARLPPVASDFVAEVAQTLLDANHVDVDCYLRLSVNVDSLGTLKEPAEAALYASLRPMGRKPWLKEGRGLAVAISDRRKPDDSVFPQSAKVICNYAGPRLAYLEAAASGFDDVILTSSEGFLAEAPTANLFLVFDNAVATPRLQDGILPGVTRKHLLALCDDLGLRVAERALTRSDALGATEAFLCGTGLELAPIARIDDVELSSRRPVFTALSEAYFALARGGRRGDGR